MRSGLARNSKEKDMTQFDDRQLTAEVIRSFEKTSNPRLKSILTELVASLHDFVRKTDLSFEEWNYAIDYLTQTGQACTATRQEFILLSDVLGVSMLVDAVNHREREGATQTTVLGPFYVGEHRPTAHGSDISTGVDGEPMFVRSRITDLDGKALAGGVVDGWHAGDHRVFYSQKTTHRQEGPPPPRAGLRHPCRGVLLSTNYSSCLS